MAVDRNQPLNQTNQSQQRVGSGFTNLQRVLSANKQNRLGQTVTQGVGDLANQNKQALGQAANQFQTDAEKNRLDTQENTNFRNQAIQNSRTGNIADADAERFQALQAGQYGGPKELANKSVLQAGAQQVQQLGTYGSDPNKTKGLLQKFVGSPRYTMGQQTLDATVLGQDPSVARGIRQQTVGAERSFNRADTASQAYAKELANRAQGFGQETQQQVIGEATAYDTEQQAKAAAANAQRAALQAKAKEQLTTGYLDANGNKISKDVADALGITADMEHIRRIESPAGGQWLAAGTNPTFDSGRQMADYYDFDKTQASKQNIQSSADFARLNALKKLGGTTLTTGDIGKTVGEYADANQVGQFAATPVATLQKNAYEQDLASMKKYLNDTIGGQINNVNTSVRGFEGNLGTDLYSREYTAEELGQRSFDAMNPGYKDMAYNNILQNISKDPAVAARIKQLNNESRNISGNGNSALRPEDLVKQLQADPQLGASIPKNIGEYLSSATGNDYALRDQMQGAANLTKLRAMLETYKNQDRKLKIV